MVTGIKNLDVKILFWIENKKIRCVDICYATKSVLFYDEDGNLLMVRRGLTIPQMNTIEETITKHKFFTKKVLYFSEGL